MHVYEEKNILLDGGDHLIPSTVTIPDATPQRGVVLLHGTGGNRNEVGGGYDTAARILAEDYGILSIRIDFQGCGDSSSDFRSFTFHSAVEDAMTAAEYLRCHYGLYGPSLGLLGWSQGGTDALLTAGNHSAAFGAVVTWAGAPDLRKLLSEEDYQEAKEKGWFHRHFDWRPDLLFSYDWCKDVKNTDVLKVFSCYPSPVLAIAGTEDTVVSPSWAKRIAEASSNENSECLCIEGMDHTFNTLREEKRESLLLAIEKTAIFFSTHLH